MAEEDILAPDQAAIDNYQETDVFAWANNMVQYKDELKIDLFLISKTFVLYRTSLAKELNKTLEPLFIDNVLEYILDGAERGLIVRGFEDAEDEEGVLQRTQVFKVDKAREVLNFLKTQSAEIETFKEEHDFKRMKGILARVSHPEIKQDIFLIKALPQSNIMSGRTGWMMREGKFMPFDADAAVRIPIDNQLLVIDQDMYVFSQTRLKQLFGYNAKEASIAEKKVAAIIANFRLSFPEDVTMQHMVAGKKSMIRKLQKVETDHVKQQQIIDHAEELDIDLMTDDSGSILIEDDKALERFVNLLNDDYMESNLTGQKYEIIKKKPVKEKDDTEA